uniref:Uncharacterized protein n=1 Tax=Lygus hesperus TaxID=30085 RepID=A0A0K8ST16_LYGHE
MVIIINVNHCQTIQYFLSHSGGQICFYPPQGWRRPSRFAEVMGATDRMCSNALIFRKHPASLKASLKTIARLFLISQRKTHFILHLEFPSERVKWSVCCCLLSFMTSRFICGSEVENLNSGRIQGIISRMTLSQFPEYLVQSPTFWGALAPSHPSTLNPPLLGSDLS